MSFKVPYIDLPKQYKKLKKDLMFSFNRVFSSGEFILRDEVKVFEEAVAEYLGCSYAVGVNSGTDALFLALYAQGFKENDEVITVSHTFVATIAVIKHCGLKPVLVDIGDDFNIDVNQIEAAITKKTRAIIPVHLNGRICDMDKIKEIAVRHNLVVIEDACQAFGAGYKGKSSGTFGIGCFSLHPMKNLGGAGDGGVITVNDESLAEKLRLLRNHGQKTKEKLTVFGFNSRLDNLQAAVLNVKFKYFPQWIKKRRRIAGIYNDALMNLPQIELPLPPEEKGVFYDVYSSYCVRVSKRDELLSYLRDSGVEVFAHLSRPNHLQPDLDLKGFKLLKTERISQEVLSLPIYPEIEDEQVDYVVETIKKFYNL